MPADRDRSVRLDQHLRSLPSFQMEVVGVRSSRRSYEAIHPAIRTTVIEAHHFERHAEDWQALCRRAVVPNVFSGPPFVSIVDESARKRLIVILAWSDENGCEGGELVGALLVRVDRTFVPWPFRRLVSPIDSLAYLGSPVVDRERAGPVLRSLLRAVRTDPRLPKVIEIGDLSMELFDLLIPIVESEQMTYATFGRRRRAKLDAEDGQGLDEAFAVSIARSLERRCRKLAKSGDVQFSSVVEPRAVAVAIEEFLRLEASGWKGKRGTAILCDVAAAAGVRRFARDLARSGDIAIHRLALDGKVLAMGIILTAGRRAFTWRTAYDEDHGRHSPGKMLLEWTTLQLLSDRRFSVTDSLNERDVGMQAETWPGRHEHVDVLIDVRASRRPTIEIVAAARKAKRLLRASMRRLVISLPKPWVSALLAVKGRFG